jgi:hypothetical protein
MKSSSQDYSKYILPVAVVVGGYFILKQFGVFGGGASAANQKSITDTASAGVNNSIAQAKAAGDFATLSDSEAAGLANQIYNAGVSDPVDQDTIQNSVIQANTLTDLLMIMKAFGTKQAGGFACSLFGGMLSSTCGTYDMNSWITANLDQAHISTINTFLNNQGINYQF